MLQNRVTPYGQIIKTTARGAWMGNRGLLHDDGQQILRPYKLKAWLTCLLEFKGWKRTVMSPRRYTELFFYDEATAYAAGHRPCFECRRQDYNHFKTHWLKGNPEYGFDAKVSIQQIDAILHRERIDKQGVKVKYEDQPDTLPDGTFIELDEKPYLIYKGSVYEWSPFGYAEKKNMPELDKVMVLTPKSVVNAFKEGLTSQFSLKV